MAIITLTSDWGTRDHYTGAVKGTILRLCPAAQIIDITHEIPHFNVQHAAYILKNCYPDFPEGTVHIVDVTGDQRQPDRPCAVFHNGHYFIGPDNGIFSLLFDGRPEQMYLINDSADNPHASFAARQLFVPAACHIMAGNPIESLGVVLTDPVIKMPYQPVIQGDLIKGHVIHIDAYGNVLTNISEKLFRATVGDKPFRISFRSPGYKIEQIGQTYKDGKDMFLVALFSSTGFLEIAIRNGKASGLLGLKQDDMIMLEIL